MKKCLSCNKLQCMNCLTKPIVLKKDDRFVPVPRSGYHCSECCIHYSKCEICEQIIQDKTNIINCEGTNCYNNVCKSCWESKAYLDEYTLCSSSIICSHKNIYHCKDCLDRSFLNQFKINNYIIQKGNIWDNNNYGYLVKNCCKKLICKECVEIKEECSNCCKLYCKGCLREIMGKDSICPECEEYVLEEIRKTYSTCSMNEISRDIMIKYKRNSELPSYGPYSNRINFFLPLTPCITVANLNKLTNDDLQSPYLLSYDKENNEMIESNNISVFSNVFGKINKRIDCCNLNSDDYNRSLVSNYVRCKHDSLICSHCLNFP